MPIIPYLYLAEQHVSACTRSGSMNHSSDTTRRRSSISQPSLRRAFDYSTAFKDRSRRISDISNKKRSSSLHFSPFNSFWLEKLRFFLKIHVLIFLPNIILFRRLMSINQNMCLRLNSSIIN